MNPREENTAAGTPTVLYSCCDLLLATCRTPPASALDLVLDPFLFSWRLFAGSSAPGTVRVRGGRLASCRPPVVQARPRPASTSLSSSCMSRACAETVRERFRGKHDAPTHTRAVGACPARHSNRFHTPTRPSLFLVSTVAVSCCSKTMSRWIRHSCQRAPRDRADRLVGWLTWPIKAQHLFVCPLSDLGQQDSLQA